MEGFKRYAVYFAPESRSDLARLGAQWLGWDVNAGRDVDHFSAKGLPVPLSEITRTPRKYGFHGTLKPPFRMDDGAEPGSLDDALSAFVSRTDAFSLGRMQVARLSRFVAIVPVEVPDALEDLARDCVMAFDAFRAPLHEAELEKRRKGGLSDRQEALLRHWGYPYVMEEFRFHLTLTGGLLEGQSAHVAKLAAEMFADALEEDIPVRDICLFGEREDGRFVIIKRYSLGG